MNNFDPQQDAESQQKSDWQSISSGLSGALDSFALSALRRRQFIIALFTIVVINVIDQVSKQIARTQLLPFSEISSMGGLLRFHHSENPGAFLSLGAQFGANMRLGIFTVLVIVFLVWASWMLIRKLGHVNLTFVLGWSLLIAGGIGNVIDRIAKGTVTDFMIFGFGPVQTGVLNIADMAITFGILIVLFLGRETTPA